MVVFQFRNRETQPSNQDTLPLFVASICYVAVTTTHWLSTCPSVNENKHVRNLSKACCPQWNFKGCSLTLLESTELFGLQIPDGFSMVKE